MGRGRAKAKQVKVARRLKYNTGGTDLNRLREELGVGSSPSSDQAADSYDDPYEDLEDRYSDDLSDEDSDEGADEGGEDTDDRGGSAENRPGH